MEQVHAAPTLTVRPTRRTAQNLGIADPRLGMPTVAVDRLPIQMLASAATTRIVPIGRRIAPSLVTVKRLHSTGLMEDRGVVGLVGDK